MKKPREYNGHVFEDNGYGDLFNGEIDKFLIFRPYPLLVDTIIHKDGSVTMNQDKFKQNTDENKGSYSEGYELNDDGSVFVKAEDVSDEIKKESEENRTTISESEVDAKDDNLEDSGLDNFDKEKLEGLLGYGIPQDVSDDFTDITGEESQAIEDAIAEIDDSLTGYEELNDFEEQYGAIRDYDRLDNLEYDLSEYLGNKIDEGEIDESFKTDVENIIGNAEDTANETLDYDIQAYLDSHKFGVEEGDPSGLNTKEDYEHDLKWFEEMEVSHGTKGLANNEDYQSLKEEYESKFNTTWNTPEELLNAPGQQEGAHEYRFDFGFKDGSSLRSDAFEDAKAYLEEEDMAQYLDEPLKSKIDSMKWVLDDESSVHVEVKSNQPLSDEDMKALKSEIEGQNSDGLGEGFEQQDFAQSYYDPETGDGPYTYQEVLDIVQENFNDMEFDEYRDYIDYDDVREGLENYLRDGNYDVSFEDFLIERHDYEDEGYESEDDFRAHLENTSEEELFEEYSEEYDNWLDEEESSFIDSGQAQDYINQSAIDNAMDEVAKNDSRYNENLWGDGMVSMEWDIPDGIDITPKSETVTEDIPNNLPSKGYSDYQGLMLADQDKYGEYEFSDNNDLDNLAKSIVNDLNKNKIDDYSDFDYRIDNGHIEIFDKNEAVGSEASDYHKLEKELKKQLGDSIYLEPYDSVTTTIAGIYGQRDSENIVSPGIAQQMIDNGARKINSDDELLNKVDKHYSNKLDDYTVSEISLAFNDINDSHAFGINKAVDKLLEYGEVVKVNAGNNGTNRVEVEVNNGQGKIIFTDDGASLTGKLDAKQLGVYDEAIKEYEKNRNSDVSFNFNTERFEGNLPKNTEMLVPIDPYSAEEEARRITEPRMNESRRVSVLNGFEEDAYPRRSYMTKQDAYNAYQNGDISFEEYEEIVRKLARR